METPEESNPSLFDDILWKEIPPQNTVNANTARMLTLVARLIDPAPFRWC
jgi:hypothetical protein